MSGAVAQLYLEALPGERSATPEQIDAADEAQFLFNITFLVDRHLAVVIPACDTALRGEVARDIAPLCNGEGVALAARRYALQYMRKMARDKFNEDKLGDRFCRNDTGNAERFAAEFSDDYRFLDDRQIWMRWDGRRWCKATDAELATAAKTIAKQMLLDAVKTENKEELAWAQSTLSRKGLNNMVACAANDELLRARMSDFDQSPELLNVLNGTIDLSTGYLRAHAREDMLTNITEISYDADASAPRFERYLREVFVDDEELIDFVQCVSGYSLTGLTREQCFFILWGGGQNGKGIFIRLMSALAGTAHRTTGFKTFTATRDDMGGNTPALATLAGGRLVTAGEPDEGVRFSESVIKSLTGEDEIQVCAKYESPFSYRPAFKIWLHVNHKPKIRGTDEGIWRRPKLIPFIVAFMTEEEAKRKNVTGPRRDPDKKLEEKLQRELPGILAWAVRGAMRWFAEGLKAAKAVDTETDRYREESDPLRPFIDECVKDEPGKFVTNDRLCEAYSNWCKRNLIQHEMNGQTLSRHMVMKGYVRGKDPKDQRGFKDISLVVPGGLMGVN